MGENYFMTTDNIIAIIQQQFWQFFCWAFSFRINSIF